MNKLLLFLGATLAFMSCKKESETLDTARTEDYAPLVVGKSITYSLDSLIYTNFGAVEAHRFYDVKFVVAAEATDNQGRKGFRIARFIKPQGTGTFASDNSFFAIHTGNAYEFIENNLRYIKLTEPVKDARTWKGNAYIDANASGSGLSYLDNWDYTYSEVGEARTINGIALPNTIKVNQRDLSDGLPVTPSTIYAQRDFSEEIYAEGIGMVYRKFWHFEYQGVPHTYEGYGVTYTMTAHD